MRNPFEGDFLPASGIRSIAKNAAFLFGLRVVQRLAGLVSLYVVVRSLDTGRFGEYQFVLSWVALVAIFALPGLNNSIVQSVARGFPGVYRIAVPRAFLCSLAGGALLTGFAVFYRSRGAGDVATGFVVAAGLFPLVHGLEQWKALRSGREDFAGILKLDGLAAVVMATSMVVAVSWKPGSLIAPLCVVLGVNASLNVLVTWRSYREIPRDAPTEAGSLNYGTKVTVYAAFNVVARQLDKLLIFFFLSPAALAIFYAAERIPELIKAVVQDVAVVLAPRFARREEYTSRMDRLLNAAGAAVSLLMVGFAFTLLPWLIVLVMGESYREATPYAQALMCSIAVANVYTLKYRYIASRLDAPSARAVNVGMASARILASLILIPMYGILGAVISAFFFRVVSAVIIHRIIRKRYLHA